MVLGDGFSVQQVGGAGVVGVLFQVAFGAVAELNGTFDAGLDEALFQAETTGAIALSGSLVDVGELTIVEDTTVGIKVGEEATVLLLDFLGGQDTFTIAGAEDLLVLRWDDT